MTHEAEGIQISVWGARQSSPENGLPEETYDYCINREQM